MDGIKPPRRRPQPQQPRQSMNPNGTTTGARSPRVSDISRASQLPRSSQQPAAAHQPPVTQRPQVHASTPVSIAHPSKTIPQPAQTHAQRNDHSQPKTSRTSGKSLTLVHKAVVGVVLVALAIASWFIASFFLFGMSTHTYDNGQGNSYQLDYYRRSTLEKFPAGQKLTMLASHVSRAGKEPIYVTITVLPNKPDDAAIYCYSEGDKKFSVKHKVSGNEIFVCPSGTTEAITMYSAIFESQGKWHRLTASQLVATENEDGVDPAEILKKRSGMAPYRNDIERIVTSVVAVK